MNFLITAFISYLLGILWGYYLVPSLPLLFRITLAFVLLGALFFLLPGLFNHRIRRILFIILSFFLFMSLGAILIRMNITQIDEVPSHHLTNYLTRYPNFTKSPVTLIARLTKPPEYFHQKTRFRFSVQKIIRPGQNLMTSGIIQLDWYNPQKTCQYQYYDTVRVKAVLRLPRDYKNPGCSSYSHYLRQKGIYVTGYIKELHPYSSAKKIPWSKKIFRRVYQLRRNICKALERTTPKPEVHLLQAFLLGERQKLSKKVKNTFREAGMAHLLSISGLHLSILAMAAFFSLQFIFRALPDKWFELFTCLGKPTNFAALLTVPFIIFYTILTGNKISTLRASIMIIVYFLALLLEKEKSLWQPLFLAALGILFWQPEALFTIDFQLTFLATGGILFIVKYLPRHPSPLTTHKFTKFLFHLKNYILYSFFLSLTAFCLTGPLIIYYFNMISPAGIFINLLAIPLMSILLSLGLGTIILFPLWPAFINHLFRFEIWLCFLISKLSALGAKTPLAFFYLPSPSKIYLLIIYGIMTFFFLLLQWNQKSMSLKKLWLFIPVLISSFCLLLFSARPSPSVLKNMRVTFLDVGKGDACFIQTPEEKTILIDGGGTYNNEFDIGRYVVAPFLWSKKVKKIDLVILSHPHPDHLHGLLFILKNFTVDQIWKSEEQSTSPGYRLFEHIIREKKIPVRHMAKGDCEMMDSILIEILAPDARQNPLMDSQKTYREENNQSLVLKLSYHEVGFLFTGDIEREAEKRLLKFGRKLRSTIIKVPHHGSYRSSSSPFLKMVSPQAAIFSARKYGNQLFPHPQTLARYQKLPCRIYRTDLDGAVTITTDGFDFCITTHNQRKSEQKTLTAGS